MIDSKKQNHQDADLHRVQFAHEATHDRLMNWAKWCNGGRGGASSSPMFRSYRAPRYREAVDEIRVPTNGLDAATLEKVVGLLPEKHRDALRWFYVYSARGMSLWTALRALAVPRDTLTRLVHDGRSMVKNRLAQSGTNARIAPKFDPAPAAPASHSEAAASVKSKNERRPAAHKELHPA